MMALLILSFLGIWVVPSQVLAVPQLDVESANEKVWQWFNPCPDNAVMHIEVLLGEKRLYATSFPVCVMRRGDIPIESPQKTLRFVFKADLEIFGEEFSNAGEQEIVGNIWRAGGESDGMILGVSFMAGHRSLLNTLHFPLAEEPSTAELAEGLFIKASKVKPKAFH